MLKPFRKLRNRAYLRCERAMNKLAERLYAGPPPPCEATIVGVGDRSAQEGGGGVHARASGRALDMVNSAPAEGVQGGSYRNTGQRSYNAPATPLAAPTYTGGCARRCSRRSIASMSCTHLPIPPCTPSADAE